MKIFQSVFKSSKEADPERNDTKHISQSSFTQPRPPLPPSNRLNTQTLQPKPKLIVEYTPDFKEKIRQSQPEFKKTSEILQENREKLNERGVKIDHLANNAKKMKVCSENFLDNCRKIREETQGKQVGKKKVNVYSTDDETNNQNNCNGNLFRAQVNDNHYKGNMVLFEDVNVDEETEKKLKKKDEKLIENVKQKNKMSMFNCC